uniref:Protein proton gradient regulation 5, chloroplastic-like n=1 Tax=Tanacetum cinerariifolium TaxID=118510 RepID=A0A699IYN2_TANCI|nr:protein proton gradient regulation 5, chloroplastic-like [Tanacetum cinerariifolium]
MATSSITPPANALCSSFYGKSRTSSSIYGEDYSTMLAKTAPAWVRVSGKPLRHGPMMGNVNAGKGLFAPAVVITRNIVGKKRFNQLRGKAIALHSQAMCGGPSRIPSKMALGGNGWQGPMVVVVVEGFVGGSCGGGDVGR